MNGENDGHIPLSKNDDTTPVNFIYLSRFYGPQTSPEISISCLDGRKRLH